MGSEMCIRDRVSSALQKQGTPLPLLRKDFIVESYQVWQSRAMGADAILLIVAALSQQKFEQLLALTAETGMDVLIEVHTEEELHRAVASMKKVFSQNTQTTTEALLGFNNRDLNSFTTDLATSIKLAKVAADLLAADDVPNSIRNTLFIAESGISSAADISSLKQHGLSGFLIGESLTAKGCPQENLKKIIADSLQWMHQNNRARTHGFVIMPNHIHLLWSPVLKFHEEENE